MIKVGLALPQKSTRTKKPLLATKREKKEAVSKESEKWEKLPQKWGLGRWQHSIVDEDGCSVVNDYKMVTFSSQVFILGEDRKLCEYVTQNRSIADDFEREESSRNLAAYLDVRH